MSEQQHTNHSQIFRKYISPPNPIYSKQNNHIEKIVIQGQNLTEKKHSFRNDYIFSKQNKQMQQSDDQYHDQEHDGTLLNYYPSKNLVFKRWNNQQYCTRAKKSYFASVFYNNKIQTPPIYPHLPLKQDIRFCSKFQSGNLFAAYRTGQNMYDLVLNNDLNTSGYTQWFYFKVMNAKKFQKIQFNIVNFYKNSSLFCQGMKPLIKSMKSERGWKRGGFSVFYDGNSILVEGSRKKYYKSLSFQYQFQFDNDEVFFAPSYPYTSSDLKDKLKNLSLCSKFTLKSLGSSAFKKPLYYVQISNTESKIIKRAIVLMARQHPGQTVGSFIIEQMMSELIKPNSETQFLLWRYDIYIFPMINIDGVYAGNYRGNAYGYDLNRSWERQNSGYLPQINSIKNEIKKIAKKQAIQLVLDLHGHSRKMNSFFYGNSFGKNSMIYPFIASKLHPAISFEDSTFSLAKAEKAKTARAIIGNLVKQTGSVYTYQVSFYGSFKNGKKVHFTPDDYRQLGKSLVSAMYKNFMQEYKQEKSMKESLYFKQLRKQLNIARTQIVQKSQSGSDDQAQLITIHQNKIKQQQLEQLKEQSIDQSDMLIQNSSRKRKKRSIQIQVNQLNLNEQPAMDMLVAPSVELSRQRKLHYKIKSTKPNNLNISKHFQGIKQQVMYSYDANNLQNSKSGLHQFNRKKYLMDKLRIFGQTFVQSPTIKAHPKSYSVNHKIIQTSQSNYIPLKHYLQINEQGQYDPPSSPLKNMYRKKKSKNNSLMIKNDEQRLKMPITDMQDINLQRVQINKIQYKKIKRKDNYSNPHIKMQDITKLPIL